VERAPDHNRGLCQDAHLTRRQARLELVPHPHMLRHACRYKLANDGVDTRTIQDYLGPTPYQTFVASQQATSISATIDNRKGATHHCFSCRGLSVHGCGGCHKASGAARVGSRNTARRDVSSDPQLLCILPGAVRMQRHIGRGGRPLGNV
jgi:hypothetical protein